MKIVQIAVGTDTHRRRNAVYMVQLIRLVDQILG